MLNVITLYQISAAAVPHFVSSLGRGGEWNMLVRRGVPSLIATDVPEPQASSSVPGPSVLFACLDFWISAEAYHQACQNPAYQALILARRQMAESSFELGAFRWSTRMGEEGVVSRGSAVN